ncbi:hypothetical protein HK098_001284 [Nowakowskiella sp. JEL0407]|nr:hypothetical protein HK098_001284 [Nowakowskiella sp. JEL0407]
MSKFFRLPTAEVDSTEFRELTQKAKESGKNWKSNTIGYILSLFPIITWIKRYNLQWLIGDLIAGFTVGCLVLPQALGQAKIATLPPEYGLYTAFVGLFIYAFLATAKDLTIGPTAVLSLLTSQILASANKDAKGNNIFPPTEFALTLAFVTGIYQLVIGIFRIGFLADLIPNSVISGFTSGAVITIIIQQIPSLLGLKGIDTNTQPVYFVVRDIAVNLPKTKVDAAIGLTAVFALYTLAFLKDRLGKKNKVFYWAGLARNGIIFVIYLVVSIIVAKAAGNNSKGEPKVDYSLVGTLPAGLKPPTIPRLEIAVLDRVWVPAATAALISIVEHMGIVRSFGRKFGYANNIEPSQEIIAQGITNFLGSFFSAYPSTGSFSRSAVKAASGVRTPLAGLFTAAIVIIALYGLTGVFYFIPSSLLSAIIIASISDMISRLDTFIHFWSVSLIDFVIFITSFAVTLFVNVEVGIYTGIIFTILVTIIQTASPSAKFRLVEAKPAEYTANSSEEKSLVANTDSVVLIIRITQSLIYGNARRTTTNITEFIRENIQYEGKLRPASERIWCDNAQEIAAKQTHVSPVLHSIIFDFSAVTHFDSDGYDSLIEVRGDITKYIGRVPVIHFVSVAPEQRRLIRAILNTPYTEDVIAGIEGEYTYERYDNDDELFFDDINSALAKSKSISVVHSPLKVREEEA